MLFDSRATIVDCGDERPRRGGHQPPRRAKPAARRGQCTSSQARRRDQAPSRSSMRGVGTLEAVVPRVRARAHDRERWATCSGHLPAVVDELPAKREQHAASCTLEAVEVRWSPRARRWRLEVPWGAASRLTVPKGTSRADVQWRQQREWLRDHAPELLAFRPHLCEPLPATGSRPPIDRQGSACTHDRGAPGRAAR
jgi:hypothetical protein